MPSLKNEDEFLAELLEYCGGEKNIPNPDQYPMRFEFLIKSFQHYKRMQEMKVPQKGVV